MTMTSNVRWTIIANPTSGKGASRDLAGRLGRLLADANVSNEVLYTTRAGEAESMAREAVEGGREGVLACGGDGTFHEVVNGVMSGHGGREVTVGVAPSGRCNDFAAALSIPKSAAAIRDLILSGRSRPVDLGVVDGRYYATVATLGFDSTVSQYVADGHVPRFLKGTPSYLYAIFLQLFRYRDAQVSLQGDNFRFSGRAFLAATANTRQYGGNMRIAPEALPNDGMLDVCLVKSVSRCDVVMILPKVFKGGHISHPAVSIHRVKGLKIETETPMPIWADGERVSQTPAEISVEAGALNILA